MVKCIVFDFDGVLIDSNVIKRNAYFMIFSPIGSTEQIIKKVLVKKYGGDRYQIIGHIIDELSVNGFLYKGCDREVMLQHYTGQYNKICEEYAVSCSEIKGVSKILPRLAGHYALYINSATPQAPLRRIVSRRGWGGYFRGVFGRPCTKIENLRKTLKFEEIINEDMLFIGDDHRDLEAAAQCGCRFVGMVHETSNFVSVPYYRARDFTGIEPFINWTNRDTVYAAD